MHISIKITMIFYFLFRQRVCSSSTRYSILENQTLSVINDDTIVLEKYFDYFYEVNFQKGGPWMVVIVGTSAPDFQGVIKSVIKKNPSTICKDLGTCQDSVIFGVKNFFIIFLDDLGEEAFQKNANILSSCTSDCQLLYVFKGVNPKSDDILSYLIKSDELCGPLCEFVHLEKNVVKHYGLVFTKNCSYNIDTKIVWTPENDLSKLKPLLFHRIPNMHGCPVSVGSFSYLPEMIIDESKNGSLTIVGGLDGMLVTAIAKKLNFTIVLKQPRLSDGVSKSRTSNMFEDIESGTIEFGVGRFHATAGFVFSKTFDEECITFAVPRKRSSIISNILWKEFSWKMWTIIGLILVVGCILEYIFRVMILHIRNGDRRDSEFSSTVLDIVSMYLGIPVTRVPISASGRLTFATYMCYALVLTTAYKTSLSSIMTTAQGSPRIITNQGIIDANIKVGGSFYHRGVLADHSDNVEAAYELLKRYEVFDNHSEAMHRLKVDQNFAYLGRRTALTYERNMAAKNQQYVTFDVFDHCVCPYAVKMVFRNGSHLLSPVNEIMSRVKESDLLHFWDVYTYTMDSETLEHDNNQRILAESTRQKFQNIFICFCCCLVFCILIFFIELLIGRFKHTKIQQLDRSDILL